MLLLTCGLLTAFTAIHCSYADKALTTEFLTLTNSTLKDFDGVPGVFDGYSVINVTKVMNALRGRLSGVKGQEGIAGIYTFHGKKYTLWQLADLDVAGQIPASEYQALLISVRSEFEKFINPFMSRLNIAKNFVIVLMRESCAKRNKNNSFMLSWTSVENGKEFALFHKAMNSFEDLAIFFEELYYFLGDMIKSCPKGCELAKKIKEKQQRD